MARLEFKNGLTEGIKKYNSKIKEISPKALAKTAIQLLNFVVNGSQNSSVTPPVLTGRLRGSGSVFFESNLIKVADKVNGEGTPNTSLSGQLNTITIGFNTPYAARWHEDPFTPGPVSSQSGNVGNKYIEKHLKADGKDLMKFYSLIMKKDVK